MTNLFHPVLRDGASGESRVRYVKPGSVGRFTGSSLANSCMSGEQERQNVHGNC